MLFIVHLVVFEIVNLTFRIGASLYDYLILAGFSVSL